MDNLTSQQANALANDFSSLAQALSDYRHQNFDNLSELQSQTIKDLHESILDHADRLLTLSATLVMEDVQTSLTSIKDITGQIKDTYQTLQNIQKAIDIATSVVNLGASIISKNPQAIAGSIDNLLTIVTQ